VRDRRNPKVPTVSHDEPYGTDVETVKPRAAFLSLLPKDVGE